MAGLLNGCTNENVNIGNTLQNSSVLDKVIDMIYDNFDYNGKPLYSDSEFVIHDDWEGVNIGDDVLNFHDELDVIEFIMAFKEEWGLTIPNNEAENFETVGDIVKYIEENN